MLLGCIDFSVYLLEVILGRHRDETVNRQQNTKAVPVPCEVCFLSLVHAGPLARVLYKTGVCHRERCVRYPFKQTSVVYGDVGMAQERKDKGVDRCRNGPTTVGNHVVGR